MTGFYRYPYDSSTESNTVELIHDTFQSLSDWDGFMVDGYNGVAMDTHIYQMFSDEPLAITKLSLTITTMKLDLSSGVSTMPSWPLAYGKVVLLHSFLASSSEKENSGNVKELLPDGSVLRVYRHHEAESHHHHHKAGSFLRRVHHAIMALGLWEGRAVAFILMLFKEVVSSMDCPSRRSQTPNHQDDNINFKIVSTLAPQDPLQSLPQPQWDL
ncbi:uncharacterized protein BJ212DRAFT_1553416 [Suillus subaureus]|uniref:Uncharacterized protein n=1 Tax=Suillus subaureus TaxID=48587 RepID=A0A9P7EFW5_9AGAM|nr:uncharacterized protein BJ212DRAFT_1553416 [Suillus subaureus]KAG1820572.1 hypothetical protein BJ212DRAFT_1553416 [Suillus subaureus]